MPRTSKSSRDSFTREVRAKRSRSKASDTRGSDNEEVDMPPGYSAEFKVIGKVHSFEVRARVRRRSSCTCWHGVVLRERCSRGVAHAPGSATCAGACGTH